MTLTELLSTQSINNGADTSAFNRSITRDSPFSTAFASDKFVSSFLEGSGKMASPLLSPKLGGCDGLDLLSSASLPGMNCGEDPLIAFLLQRKLEEQKIIELIQMRRAKFSSSTMPNTQDLLLSAYRLGQMSTERRNSAAAASSSQSNTTISPLSKVSEQAETKTATTTDKSMMGRNFTFPQKLHKMLSDLEEEEGGCEIASFLPNGNAFAIHRPLDFVKHVMPKYFERMSRFSSFQRQLNLYDFKRVTEGPDAGAYYHELFVQGDPLLCTWMKRNKIKGAKTAAATGQQQQPQANGGTSSSQSNNDEKKFEEGA